MIRNENVINAAERFRQAERSFGGVNTLDPGFRVFRHLRDEVARELGRPYEKGDAIKRAWLEVCARGDCDSEQTRMLRLVGRM